MNSPVSKNRIVSKVMRANKGKGTSLELKVKKAVSSSGVKGYRLNVSGIPSRPDIAFSQKKIAVVVNGCFWHGCRRCSKRISKTNRRYWSWKIETNRKRDKRDAARLKRLGWRVYKIWEHDAKKGDFKPLVSWLKKELKKRV